MLRFAATSLDEVAGVDHAFFTRKGGVSTGIYRSLNCGPGSRDDEGHVVENRRHAVAALTERKCRLVTLYQVHSAEAVLVDAPWDTGSAPRADSAATDIPGIALGILTADCAPVLLADAQARVIGAAHAGWKGALAGVAESAVAAMVALGARAERIAAAIGPCISQSAYEVGKEFRAAVLVSNPADGCYFTPSNRDAHWRFDLPGYVRRRLATAGVQNVTVLGLCTYAQESTFFSYRRATHRGEPDYGRQLSAIVLL
ncbi:MAG: peptidoglycan editing factor PgeF [Rhizomicrobium sp.]